MKKNNTAEKSIFKAEELSKALREGTDKTLRNLVNEAISNLILENEEDTEEPVEDENNYEVEDVDVENDSNETDEPEIENEKEEEASETEEDEENDEWSDFEEFKTDENDYDITDQDEKGIEILQKMFNMLEDGDELIVTKNGDDMEISNEKTGEEEVVTMSDEEDNDSLELPGEETEDEFEIEIENDGENVDIDDEDGDIEIDIDDDDDEYEIEIDDEEITESLNLGYTDNYQSKTAMTTPSNKEVANSKDTYSMDDVPEGDGKRWAGKGNTKPYGTEVCCENEDMEIDLEESTNVGGAVQQRSSSKSKVPAGRKNYVPKGTRHASFGDSYEEIVESYNKIKNAYKQIKQENETLKENVKVTKKSLFEAAVLNVNLGKVLNLLVNETTTRDEKKSILSRFNEVKTISEGTTLYNNIKRELNENKKTNITLDKSVVVESKSKKLNETTFYTDRTKNPSLNLMDRMDNLFKRK